MVIIGGGASGARDKVFQSNGRGTMHIKDFYVEWLQHSGVRWSGSAGDSEDDE